MTGPGALSLTWEDTKGRFTLQRKAATILRPSPMKSLLSVSEPITAFLPERGLVEGTLWREPSGSGFFAVEYCGSRWYDAQVYASREQMIEPAKAVLRKAAQEIS